MLEPKEKIKIMLETLPDKIRAKEKEILEKTEEADKVEREIKSTENSYTAQISDELEEFYDEKKKETVTKKKFRNDTERNAELKIRLKRNDIYRANIISIVDLRKEINEGIILISYLKRRFRAGEGLARIGV